MNIDDTYFHQESESKSMLWLFAKCITELQLTKWNYIKFEKRIFGIDNGDSLVTSFILRVRLLDHSLVQVKKRLFSGMRFEEYWSLQIKLIYS